jgi:PAS domain-containing protein
MGYTEYQAVGREVPSRAVAHDTASSKSVIDAVSTIQTTSIGTEAEDEWKNFTKTIDTLEYPVFAIDKTGVVIIWNKSMEQLTGVPSQEMVVEIGDKIPFL